MSKPVPTYELYGERSGETPDFWLHCETIPARSQLHRWEIGMHRHQSFFQLLYISAGSGDAIFEAQTLRFMSPSVISVPMEVEHGFRFSPDIDGLVVTVIAHRLTGLPVSWTRKAEVLCLDTTQDAVALDYCLRRLGEEYADRRTGRDVLLDASMKSALVLFARLTRSADGSGQEGQEDGRLARFDSLLHRHVREHHAAGFYADALGISPTHLSRIVRAGTGLGLHQLIARKLTEEAKSDLVFTSATVKEIGLRLGFADPAYFSRFFLRQTGITPGVWRQAEKARMAVSDVAQSSE